MAAPTRLEKCKNFYKEMLSAVPNHAGWKRNWRLKHQIFNEFGVKVVTFLFPLWVVLNHWDWLYVRQSGTGIGVPSSQATMLGTPAGIWCEIVMFVLRAAHSCWCAQEPHSGLEHTVWALMAGGCGQCWSGAFTAAV